MSNAKSQVFWAVSDHKSGCDESRRSAGPAGILQRNILSLATCCLFSLSAVCEAQIFVPVQGIPNVPPGARVQVRPAVPVQPAVTLSTHQSLVKLATGHAVCLVVGEGIASNFVGSTTVDEGPFQDFVMGAQVNGVQKTNARTSVDFTPDPDAARMLFVLKGVTENETVAQLPRAAVRSAGTFHFELTKQIEFNGQNIRTWSPSAFMTINQQNLGASTPVNNVPLLGPLASNIVLNVADQRKPISEGIAARRVTDQIAPHFNSRLDQELAKLNETLQGMLKTRANQNGMLPSRISTLTTSDALLCGLEFQPPLLESADVRGFQLVKATRAPTVLVTRQLVPGNGPTYGAEPGMQAPEPCSFDSKPLRDRACLLLHASLVENLADRFHLAGRAIPDTQLQKLVGMPVPAGAKPDTPQLFTLVFAQENPVTAEIHGGELIVAFRVSFRPVVGPELPAQIIRVVMSPTLTDDQILVKPELHSIEPVTNTEAGKLGLAANTIIRQAVDDRLKEFTFNRSFDVPRSQNKTPFTVRVHAITLVDGWLTAILEQPGEPQAADASFDEISTTETR